MTPSSPLQIPLPVLAALPLLDEAVDAVPEATELGPVLKPMLAAAAATVAGGGGAVDAAGAADVL